MVKVLSITFCSCFLIYNDFLPKSGKTQTNFFCGTMQIFGCLTNTFFKYIFMQPLTKILGHPLLRKICFNFRISKCRVLSEELIKKPPCNKVEQDYICTIWVKNFQNQLKHPEMQAFYKMISEITHFHKNFKYREKRVRSFLHARR